jgi:hypothetical protein
MSLKAGNIDTVLDLQMDQATLIANTGFELVAPADGFVSELRTAVQGAVTTGGTITVWVNGVQVAGLSITVANAATKGTRALGTPTPKTQTRAVLKGDRIEVRTAGFATAGSLFAALAIAAANTDTVIPY